MSAAEAAIVERAITSRRSIRAFLPTPLPRALVEHLLDVAARAPSGSNMQPWRAHVLTGAIRQRLSETLVARDLAGEADEPEYRYYPERFFEPYHARRRATGWGLYALLGIGRGETEKMRRQHARNYEFFGAPVGIIFTIHRGLEIGSWLDYGMFLQNLMVAARGHGLDSCPQAAFARHHMAIRATLDLPREEVVVCGFSLGYADPDAPENRLVTERVPARDFSTFGGWD